MESTETPKDATQTWWQAIKRLLRKLVDGRPGPQLRIKLFLTGVVFPIGCLICLATGMGATMGSHWQSGNLGDYVAMLFRWYASSAFVPLLFYSAACLGAWTIRPEVERRFALRLGTYAGVILSLQFLIFCLITSGFFTLLSAVFVGPSLACLVWILDLIARKNRKYTILEIFVLTTIIGLIAAVLRNQDLSDSIEAAVFMPLFGILTAAPTLCFVSYFRSAVCLLREVECKANTKRLVWISALVVWFAAFVASWRIAILRMLEEYAKLPTEPPDCYVSSAAAEGHPWIVGSEPLHNGQATWAVNPQMRRMKFLEFALASATPRVHRLARRFYNRVGPRLAELCRSQKLFADASYLCFLPLDIVAWGLIRLLRIDQRLVDRLYR